MRGICIPKDDCWEELSPTFKECWKELTHIKSKHSMDYYFTKSWQITISNVVALKSNVWAWMTSLGINSVFGHFVNSIFAFLNVRKIVLIWKSPFLQTFFDNKNWNWFFCKKILQPHIVCLHYFLIILAKSELFIFVENEDGKSLRNNRQNSSNN